MGINDVGVKFHLVRRVNVGASIFLTWDGSVGGLAQKRWRPRAGPESLGGLYNRFFHTLHAAVVCVKVILQADFDKDAYRKNDPMLQYS